ncbi:hypothetical protein D4Q76_01375, partial [archaeon]
MFGSGKKKIEDVAEEARKARMRKVMEEASPHVRLDAGNSKFYGTDYRQFLKEIKTEPQGLYEKSCSFAEKLLRIKQDAAASAGMEEKLKTAYINASPSGVLSLSLLLLIALPATILS